jgi:chromosome partitioning protein
MSMEKSARPARVIVVGNEKGGSGKSTVAMHVAVALMKARQSVATVDLDFRQRSLTRYVENRRTWGQRIGRALDVPQHLCPDAAAGTESERCTALAEAVDALAQSHGFIVIDTPGHDGAVSRLAHAMADTLITPLNDSFVDFDVLGAVDPDSFAVTGISHYATMVQEVRRQRDLDGSETDWIVMRNRLSMVGTRNKRLVGAALQELSQRLDFRTADGFAERMIFREFYPRGLTALDDFNEATLGTRPTLSHVTARQEVAGLLDSLSLAAFMREADAPQTGDDVSEGDRHAA